MTTENTATGHFWGRSNDFFGEELKGKALCSECTPTKYQDGSPNPRGGKWHGKFEKRTREETIAFVARVPDAFVYTAGIDPSKDTK